MAIVHNAKVNGVYFAYDNDLKIGNYSNTSGHLVIVTSINKKRSTARVKTITSLEDYDSRNNRWVFRLSKINDVKNGKILAIPKNEFRTSKFSGVHHDSKTIKLNRLFYKHNSNRTRFPTRYAKLIHKK